MDNLHLLSSHRRIVESTRNSREIHGIVMALYSTLGYCNRKSPLLPEVIRRPSDSISDQPMISSLKSEESLDQDPRNS
ncbi:hypothetical protein J6590_039939 [Homalodisca vitripennis]|nr:hypothetical protein J6590_039939 [Homalodisca vitripennis]